MTYTAIPCQTHGCCDPDCTTWMIDPVAFSQSVSFTKEQAEAVAHLLNQMENPAEAANVAAAKLAVERVNALGIKGKSKQTDAAVHVLAGFMMGLEWLAPRMGNKVSGLLFITSCQGYETVVKKAEGK